MGRVYFFTGFPGFIAGNIIKHLIGLDSTSQFELLVHPSQLEKADQEIRRLVKSGCGHEQQYSLLPGDITVPGLGLSEATQAHLRECVQMVFHLAAIYDLAVPYDTAYRVNVTGTQHVNDWVLLLKNVQRYVYFSTAYVSGDRSGKILETELVMDQSFKNHYESTKYEAEVLVQNIRHLVPITIIRPGIVMGDSTAGETAKFDGPYFVMRFLDRFAKLPIPYLGKGDAQINLVPVDYIVQATSNLAHASSGENKVYHLTDPCACTAREVYEMICEHLIGKKPSWAIPPALVSGALRIPSIRKWTQVEQETIAYFQCPADYDATEAARDLAGSGIECPRLHTYIKQAVEFYKIHRDDPDKKILVY